MSNSTEIKAIKRRAAKVDAHPDTLARFIKLAEISICPMAKNGNGMAWRKNGVVARCSGGKVDGNWINYELSVKTIWDGRDYTTVTKIEKIVMVPNGNFDFHTIARAEVKTEWKSA